MLCITPFIEMKLRSLSKHEKQINTTCNKQAFIYSHIYYFFDILAAICMNKETTESHDIALHKYLDKVYLHYSYII